MKKNEDLAERIKHIRLTLKEKQKDFARRLHISGPSLSEIETGKYKPNFDFLVNMSREYNINLYYLILGEGEMIRGNLPETGEKYGDWAVNAEEVRRFLNYFQRSPLIQYLILGHFRSILLKESESIEKEMEMYKSRHGE